MDLWKRLLDKTGLMDTIKKCTEQNLKIIHRIFFFLINRVFSQLLCLSPESLSSFMKMINIKNITYTVWHFELKHTGRLYTFILTQYFNIKALNISFSLQNTSFKMITTPELITCEALCA